MTKNDFDPRNLGLYKEPKQLLHFQWQDDTRVYRYALVEIIDEKILIVEPNKKKMSKV